VGDPQSTKFTGEVVTSGYSGETNREGDFFELGGRLLKGGSF
jgi:hypothetical protein